MNSDKSDIQRLVFSGKREDFQTWMDAFRGELQKRWLKARVDTQNAKRAVCDVSYESWLTGPFRYCHRDLAHATEIWRMLERDFGESSVAGVIGLLTKFVGTLTSDYRHVGDHFKAMSALRNRINAQSVKCFGEPIVSEQLVGALFLSLLPQQYFGSSVKFTKDTFTMDKVFQLVVNTFGSKSKRDILSMSTGFGKSLSKSEFPVGQILANERKRKPNGGQNECFYCNGKYNEGAKVHMKKDCRKRKEDFAKGY
ncbi:hypothetical protein DYB26_012768 [Aphanomyces astaci]|uniref:Uncharacterized protein n=1 Tax=Aphanomyces astaci TaxID=112090 RepID=A0A418E6C5_APHAT|nr:hypothetical protein DYB26_012768 [Aphanomyces astaci]